MPVSRHHRYFAQILIVSLAAMAAMSPFAIDSYIAALPMMARFFGVSLHVAELTITLYFLGFAVGNFIGGPLSDSFGRKTVALSGITLYGLAALAIPFCGKIEYILALRLVQAFGGGFATVTTNIFVRDWFDGKQVARFVTIIGMIIMLAPLFAPVFGAALIGLFGWKSIFLFLFSFAVFLWLALFFLIPESREKKLITFRFSTAQLLGKYKVFFSNRQSVIMLFAVSLPMSGMYIFITSASFIYIETFKVSQVHFPLFFGANVLLNILLSLLNTYLLRRYNPDQILRVGLLMQLFSAVALAISVSVAEPSLWAVFASIVFYVGSLGLVFGNGTGTIMNHNPAVAGSASATIGIARFLLSFVIGSLLALFHTGNLLPFGFILLFCSLGGNILFAWALRTSRQ